MAGLLDTFLGSYIVIGTLYQQNPQIIIIIIAFPSLFISFRVYLLPIFHYYSFYFLVFTDLFVIDRYENIGMVSFGLL